MEAVRRKRKSKREKKIPDYPSKQESKGEAFRRFSFIVGKNLRDFGDAPTDDANQTQI